VTASSIFVIFFSEDNIASTKFWLFIDYQKKYLNLTQKTWENAKKLKNKTKNTQKNHKIEKYIYEIKKIYSLIS